MTLSSRFGPCPEECQLLIAEANSEIGEGLRDFFLIKGYQVTLARKGPPAFEELTSARPYDVAILGGRLPEKGGFSVLRDARRQGVDTPVIVLTTLVEVGDKIRAFQLGADDYVTKPFEADELAARVRAVLRRGKQNAPSKNAPSNGAETAYSFGSCTADLQAREVVKDEQDLGLTKTEFDVLECLIRKRGRPVSREELLREIWGAGVSMKTRRLSRHIASLRQKIEPDPKDPSYVQTVFGAGYKFVG